MKYSSLLLSICLIPMAYFSSPDASYQASNTVVVQIQDFDSKKNMAVYTLFDNDQNVVVVNSCDVLGLVVLDLREGADMTRLEAKAYVNVKVKDIFSSEQFQVRDDMEAMQVLMDCRAEMQRQLVPSAE